MINRSAILKEIDYRKSREYVLAVRDIVTEQFSMFKNQLIDSFNQHKITREIEMGPKGQNISGTLGGRGNLFSFIGFESNAKPTEVIRSEFQKIFLGAVNVKKDGTSISFVQYPQPEDIFSITPLPWASGRSWAKGIESGLSGLGFYLNIQTQESRSGEGIQKSEKVRSAKYQNTPYISSLIREFEKNIISLNKIRIR